MRKNDTPARDRLSEQQFHRAAIDLAGDGTRSPADRPAAADRLHPRMDVAERKPAPRRMTSPPSPGATHSWDTVADYQAEVSNARIWGGIHPLPQLDCRDRHGQADRRVGRLLGA